MFRKRSPGQTFIEYTIMVGVLVTVLVAMTPMIRRGIQAMVKITADQLGSQQNSEQIGGASQQNSQEAEASSRFGRLINSITSAQVTTNVLKREFSGQTSMDYMGNGEQVRTKTKVYLNQGFSPNNN